MPKRSTHFLLSIDNKRRKHFKNENISIRNSITITFVESSDGGAWSIRPKSVRLMDPAPKMTPWCNFTVIVKMDDDDVDAAAAEELQSDQADDDYHPHLFNTPSLHPEEEESDFPMADDDVSGSITSESADGEPQSPSFIRIKKMEAFMSQVKPAGSTVTYKCPAEGISNNIHVFPRVSR
jgi:hypothetical protein